MKTVPIDEMRDNYSWKCAFHEALHGCYGDADLSCVAEVIAAVEGENDGADWLAVVRLDGTGWSSERKPYCVVRASCDYTGWDCQAGGKVEFYDTLEEALLPLTLTEEERQRLGI